jgi:hypothetical protein
MAFISKCCCAAGGDSVRPGMSGDMGDIPYVGIGWLVSFPRTVRALRVVAMLDRRPGGVEVISPLGSLYFGQGCSEGGGSSDTE